MLMFCELYEYIVNYFNVRHVMNSEEKLRENSNNVIINVITTDDALIYDRSWYQWNEFTHHYRGVTIQWFYKDTFSVMRRSRSTIKF